MFRIQLLVYAIILFPSISNAQRIIPAPSPLSIAGGTLTGPLTVPTLNLGAMAVGGAFAPILNTSGLVSDDAALQAAINACAVVGGTIYLPAGKILLTGTAGTINLSNCRIIGAGHSLGGTEIDLTSTTVAPFTIGSGWAVDNVSFYWPQQNGTVVYPPLFTTSATMATEFSLNNDTIYNAYIILNISAGTPMGSFHALGGNWYATKAAIQVDSVIGDSDHLSNIHMTPGPWINRCQMSASAATCDGYVDAGSQSNAVLHVMADGNAELFWNNSATYDWRYGVLMDAGATVVNSRLAFAWDGTGTVLESSAAGTFWNRNDDLTSLGVAVCGFHYSYVKKANDAYYPCFDIGGSNVLSLSGGSWASNGADLVHMDGGELDAAGVNLSVGGSGLTSNIYVVDAPSGVAPIISITGSKIIGLGSNPYTGGINVSTTVTGVGQYQFTGDKFIYLNQDIYIPTGFPTVVSGNISWDTDSAQSVAFSNFSYGITWAANFFDKPPASAVSACGAGATIEGTLSGNITVGSTSPTTSCTLTLPFPPAGGVTGGCVFSGVPTTISAVVSGNPPRWTLTFGADVHGDMISYNCQGNQ